MEYEKIRGVGCKSTSMTILQERKIVKLGRKTTDVVIIFWWRKEQ